PLYDRLKKNPPPWTDKHSDIIRFLKTKVRNLLCLYLPVPHAFKIVETDASDLGYGGILKQKLHGRECIIAFTSKHWNNTQQSYSTIKKEILAIVLCITKFQETSTDTTIPRKATLASAKGRGIHLALAGPIRKSGSSTPTGSSTQQPTQQSSKGSAQQSIEPAITQSKQTKTDYAFLIETILALQDQGLTRLNKKSWADIC
ncbi:hypothetical protein S245_060741, partial [Arachis hypogaea]